MLQLCSIALLENDAVSICSSAIPGPVADSLCSLTLLVHCHRLIILQQTGNCDDEDFLPQEEAIDCPSRLYLSIMLCLFATSSTTGSLSLSPITLQEKEAEGGLMEQRGYMYRKSYSLVDNGVWYSNSHPMISHIHHSITRGECASFSASRCRRRPSFCHMIPLIV